MTPEIVLGPPGTGKTTTLLNVVDEELAAGTPSNRIGYVSFTRRAAEEAIARAAERFGLERGAFPYFRTLHSLCYRQLGLRGGDVMDWGRLKEFAKFAGVEITGRFSEDGTMTGYGVGDRIIHMYNLARVRRRAMEDEYRQDHDGLPWNVVRRVTEDLRTFKDREGLVDYTDMLAEFVRQGQRPALDVLVVDEAQDNSLLQWQVVFELAKTCRRVVIAGDDDQAIYRWAGADVDSLIHMPGQVRVLGKSWRVPQTVQAAAEDIIRTVRDRRAKAWQPRDGGAGKVWAAHEFEEFDCGGEKTVLVLARNAYVLKEQIEPILRDQGIIYEKNGHLSVSASLTAAVTNWERLRRGELVAAIDARGTYEFMTSGRGVKRGFKTLREFQDEEEVSIETLESRGGLLTRAPWYEALDRLPQDDVDYVRAALQKKQSLRKARVRVSTIHSVKGAEADRVVVMKEMARRTHREMQDNPDDEARVWYVAATRAREELCVVNGKTQQECPWL